MLVAPSEQTIFFDVDDTLIMWDDLCRKGPDERGERIKVVCPHDGMVTYHRPHHRHIGFLKKQKAKGYTVVVWSFSGTGWAAEVVRSLGLEDYVDFVTSKPTKWVDDLKDPNLALGTHVYLSEEGYSL